MASAPAALHVVPNRGVGFITLGSTLHDILTRLKAQPQTYPALDLSYSVVQPLLVPVIVTLPENGLRLRFDGPNQRLRLIEVLNFTKSKLIYKNDEIVKTQATTVLDQPSAAAPPKTDTTGPTFRHVYNRLFGPTFPGEYMPPRSEHGEAKGTYVLSYPGIAFSFPIQASAYSANVDFVSMLSSSAASSATSMAIFNGSSWSEARTTLFSSIPPTPRSPSLAARAKEGTQDEIDLVRVHGEGRVELVRRFGAPFWIIMSETTPQDLVAELGPPDAIYRKFDRRLSIHGTRATRARPSPRSQMSSPTRPGELTDTDHSSSHTDTDDSEEDDAEPSKARGRGDAYAECFYNYFRHGFDIFVSNPTAPSPPSPTATRFGTGRDTSLPPTAKSFSSTHLTATKILLHANVPGSYPFKRHKRSRWTLEHVPLAWAPDPLTSEMDFGEISERLKAVWKSSYSSEEEERQSQRGMVLNRGWDDSPGSSCELLGGFEESVADRSRKQSAGTGIETEPVLGNTELFGFPGTVFEVLKNGAVSCLTVF